MVFHENGEDEEENVLCCHHGFHGETVMERLSWRDFHGEKTVCVCLLNFGSLFSEFAVFLS